MVTREARATAVTSCHFYPLPGGRLFLVDLECLRIVFAPLGRARVAKNRDSGSPERPGEACPRTTTLISFVGTVRALGAAHTGLAHRPAVAGRRCSASPLAEMGTQVR